MKIQRVHPLTCQLVEAYSEILKTRSFFIYFENELMKFNR